MSNSEGFSVLIRIKWFSEKKKKEGDFPEPDWKLWIEAKLAIGITDSNTEVSEIIFCLIFLKIFGANSVSFTESSGEPASFTAKSG